MEAELRVFVKLPADADDTYMVTGEEEVYFLYVNNGGRYHQLFYNCNKNRKRKRKGKDHQTYYHKEL